MQMEVAYNL